MPFAHGPVGLYLFASALGGRLWRRPPSLAGLVTNGMSNRARDGAFINGGFLVGVGPGDFGSEDPLAGATFQALWEEKAYAFGRPGYEAPAQRVGDFLRGLPARTISSIAAPTGLWLCASETCGILCLPLVTDTLAQALPVLDRKLHGFAAPDALMVGVETRSSSPVRLLRDKGFQSNLRGLYPCGGRGGYAGGHRLGSGGWSPGGGGGGPSPRNIKTDPPAMVPRDLFRILRIKMG